MHCVVMNASKSYAYGELPGHGVRKQAKQLNEAHIHSRKLKQL